MKLNHLLFAFFASALIYGCKSDGIGIGSVRGKWNLISDSTASTIGAGDAHIVSYKGIAGDYFDFRSDGKCYTKEGNAYDTLSYKIVISTKVIISNFGINLNGEWSPSTVTNVGSNKIDIISPEILTPGGTSYREVVLMK